jgi:steroid delta-isomerase-like uncharacterized protein
MEDNMAQATAVSPQALIDVAKATVTTYNDRDWTKARTILTPDFVYDEIATGRKTTGADQAIELWKAWAQAFPDSKGTIQNARATADGTVIVELTWKGTHKGPLSTMNGPIAATGKAIEIRACAVLEMSGERARIERHYFDMATMLRQLGVNG